MLGQAERFCMSVPGPHEGDLIDVNEESGGDEKYDCTTGEVTLEIFYNTENAKHQMLEGV